MNLVQRYLFFHVLRMVLIIVGSLTLLALLAQGLSRTDLIVESRQSALTYFYVVALGAPQVIALLTPLALFVATIWALNKIHRDSEIVVAEAIRHDTLADRFTRSPFGSLTCRHAPCSEPLGPTDCATRIAVNHIRGAGRSRCSPIRPGQFTSAGANLTFFAENQLVVCLVEILISDSR